MFKSRKVKLISIISLLIIYAIFLVISLRGEYLQILALGEKYTGIYEQKLLCKAIVTGAIFIFIYCLSYITIIFTKRGLKQFFLEDKKTMPKLPNGTIALVFSIIGSILLSNDITEKILLAINGTWFGKSDPVFNLDMGYYIFQKPLIELIVKDFIGIMIVLTIYLAAYYIIVFNKYLSQGISMETLKKNTFIKQLILNAIIIIIAISATTLINIQDVTTNGFLKLEDGTSLIGAGITDITIKTWSYRIFAVVMIFASFMGIIFTKKMNFKKAITWFSVIPAYLVLLFIVMIGFDYIYVGRNELDKEKKYIEYNIISTKTAYNINIEEKEKDNSGTITKEDIDSNTQIIENINLIDENITLSNLKEYKTNSGYYVFNNSTVGLYNIDGIDTLLYITPREIVGNETRTYNSKTYEYTHGYGFIATAASTTDENGNIKYIQDTLEDEEKKIIIKESRIYFGLETNHYIITNAKNKIEYDYPTTSAQEIATYEYKGEAGLKLGFWDKLILGIKEKNISLAFSTNISKQSKIITDRNIINRAKILMPNLIYDENPYMVVTEDGNLVWIVDAYTISDKYPYSQKTIIEYNGEKIAFNYIRNSVKIIVDAYDGTMKFYITDRTDPVIMAYRSIYPDLFEDKDIEIPESISKHFVYSEFLYDIQCEMLEKYHDVQAEVLYRCDDNWEIAKNNNTNKSAKATGTAINPYYTVIKTEADEYKIGLIAPYTILGKQNIISYLVGTCEKADNKLVLYKFKSNEAIMGVAQLDTLINQDEKISKELETLNVTGTKLQKTMIVVPIENTLLYVEPIYQVTVNEDSKNPILKKVIVASGNKIAIGDNLNKALNKLLSQDAVSVDIETDDMEEIIKQIINSNNDLKESTTNNAWEMIGNDLSKLQELIDKLETLKILEEETKENIIEEKNTILEDANILYE